MIRIELQLVLGPKLALFDSALLHELDQVSEVQAHIVDGPALIRLQFGKLSLHKCRMSLADLPHGLLVLRGDQTCTARVFQELILVSLGHAADLWVLPTRRVLLREQRLLLIS